MDIVKKEALKKAGYAVLGTKEFLGLSDSEMEGIEKLRANDAVQQAGNITQANTPVLIDGAARYMARPHAMRLVSTKDGSPLTNKVKISRNATCPCGSGKKFKNCHKKSL